MIKRIRKIINVGTFENFLNGGQFQFEKLTLIFGLNTYGKSTLSDIFRSIQKSDNEIIQKRKTIGATGTSQIEISYINDNETSEKSLRYSNNGWENINWDYFLEVFDTKFIEENIFTGFNITRDNKENLTDFILGEHGVGLAKEIEESKKKGEEIKQNKKKLEKIIKDNNITFEELKEFSISSDSDDEDNIKENINKLKVEINQLVQNKKHISDIQKLKDLGQLPLLTVSELFKKSNKIFQKSFEELNKEIQGKITEHINKNFNNTNGKEEIWIKQGLSYSKKDELANCPFCGQPLSHSEIFKIYNKYFSEEYKNFVDETNQKLNEIYQKINKELYDIKSISEIKSKLLEANRFIDKNKFNKTKEQLEELNKSIIELKKLFDRLMEELNTKIEQKSKTPYECISTVDIYEFEAKEQEINKKIENINSNLKSISQQISNFKNQYGNLEKIDAELKRVQGEKDLLEKKLLRIKLNDKLTEWEEYEIDLNETINLIKQKEIELNNSQEDFINNYFEKVNEYFENFGSNNFKIEKRTDRRGYRNTISLIVKFKDKQVDYDDFKYLFSDSDRRALAFSIFLAKLNNLGDDILGKTIVVLDDPVTSFDENRIRITINKILELSRKVKQIIIMSHYEKFLKNILQIFNENDNSLAFFKIKREANSSVLSKIEKSHFILDEHEKMFIKIRRFINRESSESIAKDLRLFLENEIKIRYRVVIYENNLQSLQLKTLVDKIYEIGQIDKEKKEKLHDFRNQLNPEHHSYIGNSNEEDIRSFAKTLFKFLYEEL